MLFVCSLYLDAHPPPSAAFPLEPETVNSEAGLLGWLARDDDEKTRKHEDPNRNLGAGANILFDSSQHTNFFQSDVEDNQPEVVEEVEVSADAASKGQMSVLDALKGVLRLSLIHDGLARGLREASKALDRRQAHMCVLNEACEEDAYKKLVIALCSEHKIPLIKVPDGKQLGEWAGLCVLDREGNARKVVNCSCVVVKDWGEESQERSILLNYFQTEQ
ncbi:40s ribosomal protein s12 [Ophiostoma piceae UAMH 11346]|uniref:40S ribosomal protein S12 n=1 Tax=Ophiostoma piceae (strain UAMH 11346) TaxID=1262450 RepID=S3CTY5_OPHP1|nr:40s ribosomal protein s12 [Ophiostoma piceae UAMH 11346]